MTRSCSRAQGREQALRRRAGAHRRRLRGRRRRGGRARRRQRRRQVDAGQGHRRRAAWPTRATFFFERRAGRASPRPQDATELGIATVYQDLALCDNLDVVANLFLGRERFVERRRAASPYCSTRRDGAELASSCSTRSRSRITERAHAGRRRSRAASARRWRSPARCSASRKVVHARRADRGAGRRADRQVLDLIGTLRERGLGGRRHQPQPGRRLRGRRPHHRAAPRAHARRRSTRTDDQRARRSSPRSPAAPAASAPAAGDEARRRRRERIERTAGATRGSRSTPRRVAGSGRRFVRRMRQGELGSLPVLIGLAVIWIIFQFQENFLTPATSPT